MHRPHFGVGKNDVGVSNPIFQIIRLSAAKGHKYSIRVAGDVELRIPLNARRRGNEVRTREAPSFADSVNGSCVFVRQLGGHRQTEGIGGLPARGVWIE